jgi:quinol monooxygenase YgiN
MSISTVAIITAKPGTGDEVEQVLRSLVEQTHTEAGCELYSLQRALENRDQFVTVEKWSSQEALQAHLGSPHLADVLQKAGHLLAAPPQIVAAEALTVGDPAKSTY